MVAPKKKAAIPAKTVKPKDEEVNPYQLANMEVVAKLIVLIDTKFKETTNDSITITKDEIQNVVAA